MFKKKVNPRCFRFVYIIHYTQVTLIMIQLNFDHNIRYTFAVIFFFLTNNLYELFANKIATSYAGTNDGFKINVYITVLLFTCTCDLFFSTQERDGTLYKVMFDGSDKPRLASHAITKVHLNKRNISQSERMIQFEFPYTRT